MAKITLRTGPTGKGSPLTLEEVDNNFTNLNIEVGQKLDITEYTASDVLAKVKLVDGIDSGLDADLVRGLNSSSIVPTATDYKASVVTRDATGNFAGVTITATEFVGPLTGNVTGDVSGNAGTTTKLLNARNINGVAFDGTQNIQVRDDNKVLKAGDTMTGFLTLNAAPVNALHAATKQYVDTYGCPQGAIIMWSGTTLPTGWGLCDGTIQNGIQTPDLRGKFVYGAQNLTEVKGTGGSVSPLTTSTVADHDHTGLTGGHALTSNEIAGHTHTYKDIRGAADDAVGPDVYDADGNIINTWASSMDDNDVYADEDGDLKPIYSTMRTDSAGNSAAHTHTIAAAGAHNHTVTPTLPPYMILAYIIKLI